MTKVKFLGAFAYSPNGYDVINYKVGDVCEIDDKTFALAIELGKVEMIIDVKEEKKEQPVKEEKKEEPKTISNAEKRRKASFEKNKK